MRKCQIYVPDSSSINGEEKRKGRKQWTKDKLTKTFNWDMNNENQDYDIANLLQCLSQVHRFPSPSERKGEYVLQLLSVESIENARGWVVYIGYMSLPSPRPKGAENLEATSREKGFSPSAQHNNNSVTLQPRITFYDYGPPRRNMHYFIIS